MKNFLALWAVIVSFTCCQNKHKPDLNVVTSDIKHYWEAYDMITSTQNKDLQYHYLDSLYFQRGTVGLEGIKEARNYTAQDYIDAINNYPKFWESLRKNTMEIDRIKSELEVGIDRLRDIYPELEPAKIYFCIGSFRTPGTTIDSLVLIGAELSMGDSTTVTSEFPENFSYLDAYYNNNPNQHQVFLNVHEYVHTQQNPRVFNNLSLTIYEGVAEFVTTIALDMESPNPQIAFGKKNGERIREVFEREMYYHNNLYKWLDGNAPNEFGMRDLGYYVGYQICENYYNQSEDKQQAIKDMIELDFSNEDELVEFVTKSDYFSAPLDSIYQSFEESRPFITKLHPFDNERQDVHPNTSQITISFSEPLNIQNTGVDYGELGVEAFPDGTTTGRFWAKDSTEWTIPVELEPNKRYQLLISNNFRNMEDIPLKPLLIDFKTAGK